MQSAPRAHSQHGMASRPMASGQHRSHAAQATRLFEPESSAGNMSALREWSPDAYGPGCPGVLPVPDASTLATALMKGKDRPMAASSCPACPDTSKCPSSATTVLVIEGGDTLAAFATLYYTYVTNQVLYAWHKGFVPSVRINATWARAVLGKPDRHTKLWERYFESYCPGAADWAARCSGTVRERRLIRPCAKGVPLPCSDFIFPWMHLQAPWSVKAWYTGRSPAHIRCQAEGWCDQYNEPLYRAWRTLGHAVVARAHRWQPSMRTRAKRAWQAFNPPPTRRPVLGVHMRGSDKGHGRRPISFEDFGHAVATFMSQHPSSGLVWIATDSAGYAARVEGEWARRWAGRVFLSPARTRSNSTRGNFEVFDPRLVADEVMTDIAVLAMCDYLLHGSSAVTEAVIYTNPSLHRRSCNLEYLSWVACTFVEGAS